MKLVPLTRGYLGRVISEEAARSGATLGEVLMVHDRLPGLVDVRRRVCMRVVKETGASAYAISKTWGVDHGTVVRLLFSARAARRATIERMAWLYGATTVQDRAARMAEDLDAWRQLGRRGGEAA